MKSAIVFAIIISLFMVAPCSLVAFDNPIEENIQLSDDQALSIAEKQFDIIMLLIKEGQFDQVLPEMRKILDLNLQGKYEEAVAMAASLIANSLAENNQYALGHQLLDETLDRMLLKENIVKLLEIQAYLYKEEGKWGKARETIERSIEIEKQRTKPRH